jgi:hypothetical protein
MRLAAVVVAVDGDQHLGLDLAEAVEHALHAEIGRARAPHRAQARGRQHRDDRLGHVRQLGGDAVAAPDAGRLERMMQPADRGVEVAPAHLAADLVLAAEDQRDRVVVPAQQVAREVEPRVGKEARTRHPVVVDDTARARSLPDHAAIGPDRAPERLAIRDRPAPQRVVAVEMRSLGGAELLHEGDHVRLRAPLGRRRPQRCRICAHGLWPLRESNGIRRA